MDELYKKWKLILLLASYKKDFAKPFSIDVDVFFLLWSIN